jgi:hypothetical protein
MSAGATLFHPAAGMFSNWECANDAIADLAQAGFPADQIVIAHSVEGEQMEREHPEKDSNEKHTLVWKLRRSFQHDLHHHGPDVLATGNQDAEAEKNEHLYSEKHLKDVLLGMGISEELAWSMDRILGRNGVLVLVGTRDQARLNKAERIIEKNAGRVRTDTMAERAPANA